jgi:DNA replication and repair protein RecF
VEIHSLSTENFRNLSGPPAEFHPALNLIVGDNGQGKTSLLEAIALLAGRIPFRGATIDEVLSCGDAGAVIAGRLRETPVDGIPDPGRNVLGLKVQDGKREHFLNGEKIGRLRARHLLPSVYLTAEDLGRLTGAPAARRSALDRVALSLEGRHGTNLRAYETARAAKTRLLRGDDADPAAIHAFERIMAETGARVAVARRHAAEKLSPVFRQHADALRSPFPDLSLLLKSDLPASGDEEGVQAMFEERMQAAGPDERRRGRCLVGPHRDDVEVLDGDRPVAGRASSGENRTLILAWTLAEADLLLEENGVPPLVAFDDFDSEWDPGALDRFAEALPAGTQLFLTSARPEAVRGLPLPPGGLFRMENGRLRRDGILGGARGPAHLRVAEGAR